MINIKANEKPAKPAWLTPQVIIKQFAHNENILMYISKYCKILKNVTKISKEMYFMKRVLESDNKIETTWDIINNNLKPKFKKKYNEAFTLNIYDVIVEKSVMY